MLTYAEAVNLLPPAEEAVIRLYVEFGASPAEVARAIDSTADVVVGVYARAQIHLREFLGPVAA